jgi:hypothetical protein
VRWLVDECVDAGMVSHLRAAGHDAVYMAEVAPRDSDADVTARAQAEQRLLLTEDKDFGDLVFRGGRSVPGVVYRKAGGGIALEHIAADRHTRRSLDLSQTGDTFARMVVFIRRRHVRS